jgi:hypothetical protein
VAHALLFGPQGRLYVPIFIPTVPPAYGEIRRYNVLNKTLPKKFDIFVPSVPGGPLHSPWFMTFGRTDPATLAYREHEEEHER